MARLFRFRVPEGRSVIAFDKTRSWQEGPGYELVLTEEEAARFLRDRRNRESLELVEVIEEESATPEEHPAPE